MPTTATPLRERLLRRWYLVALGVLLTAGICGAGLSVIPPKYVAKANVLLVPPISAAAGTGGNNVYTNLAGLQPLADVETRAMQTNSVSDQLKAQGFRGSYTVERDQTTDAPILIVTVTAKTPALALFDSSLVVAEASPTLASLQSATSVAPRDQATAQVVTKPTKAPRSWKSLIRILVVAAVVCLVGTVLITAGIDEILRRRRHLAGGEVAEADSSEDPLPAAQEPKIEGFQHVAEPAPAVADPIESSVSEPEPESSDPTHVVDESTIAEPTVAEPTVDDPTFPEPTAAESEQPEQIDPDVESAPVFQLHSYGSGNPVPRWERSLFVASDDDRV